MANLEGIKDRPCSKCAYHRETGGMLTFHLCDNPDYEVEEPDYVTGELLFSSPSCYSLRDSKEKCGPEGRGWSELNVKKSPNSKLQELWEEIKHIVKTLFA